MVLDLQCIHGPTDLQSNNPSSCLGSSLLQSLEQVLVRVGLAQSEQGEEGLQELEDAAFFYIFVLQAFAALVVLALQKLRQDQFLQLRL